MEVAKSNKEATKHSEKTSEVKKMIPSLPFEIKPLHKKALLKLLHCHHNGIFPTYPELSREMEVGEKTKAWQCEAWKHLKTNNFIVPGTEKKTFCLSEEGMVLASSFASDEELAEFMTPSSNEELHKKIRTKLIRDVDKGRKHKGKEIFDLLLEDNRASWTRLELASKLGTNPDAHSFFYGFNALKKMGLVEMVGNVTREELKRKAESLTKKSNDNDDKPKKKPKKNSIPDSDKLGGEGLVKEETCIVKTELEEKKDKTPKKKQKKKYDRIRGGTQLFSLSKKAFLVTAQKQEAN